MFHREPVAEDLLLLGACMHYSGHIYRSVVSFEPSHVHRVGKNSGTNAATVKIMLLPHRRLCVKCLAVWSVGITAIIFTILTVQKIG